tara:strand:- start:281 stop:532 length:252 start_codon:yes stop_codon:yes gene_type:complete
MDDLIIIDKLKRRINLTLQSIQDTMMGGGVDNIEKYKYLFGQAQAYQLTLREISNLLNNKEQHDDKGNVIDIGNGKDGSSETH